MFLMEMEGTEERKGEHQKTTNINFNVILLIFEKNHRESCISPRNILFHFESL